MKSFFVLAMAHLATASCLKLENLVNFGDSFSDEGRLNYLTINNGSLPPVGTLIPEINETTTSGGYKWTRFAARKAGFKSFNYAVGGATCSNKIVERNYILTNQPFPAVLDDQIPTFKADLEFDELYGNRTSDNTAYVVFIGGNDLTANGFLTDSNAPGTNITSYINSYNFPELGGRGDNQAWPNKTAYNMTDYQYKLMEYSTSAGTMLKYGAPVELLLEKRWPGATFSIFDIHSLMMDIFAKPTDYLEAPANTTDHYRQCPLNEWENCPVRDEPLNSFFWYDELHVSARIEEVVADEFLKVVADDSKYGKMYKSRSRKYQT
ncbi:hypothetical protein ACJ41O_014374 [Fusarium nematophilum]